MPILGFVFNHLVILSEQFVEIRRGINVHGPLPECLEFATSVDMYRLFQNPNTYFEMATPLPLSEFSVGIGHMFRPPLVSLNALDLSIRS